MTFTGGIDSIPFVRKEGCRNKGVLFPIVYFGKSPDCIFVDGIRKAIHKIGVPAGFCITFDTPITIAHSSNFGWVFLFQSKHLTRGTDYQNLFYRTSEIISLSYIQIDGINSRGFAFYPKNTVSSIFLIEVIFKFNLGINRDNPGEGE